tara:strand:- start:82 stop:2214 length:2133 start_codon:yes stop_codon:yes gene_type:complete
MSQYTVEFGPGPLGLTLKNASTEDRILIKIRGLLRTEDDKVGQAEQSGRIHLGDSLLKVGDRAVNGDYDSYQDVLRSLRESPRPIVLAFGTDRPGPNRRVEVQERAVVGSINMDQIRELAFHGVDDRPGLRPAYWKLLLDYLPADSGDWEAELGRRRALYEAYKAELIVSPEGVGSEGRSSRPSRLEGQAWWEHREGEDRDAAAVPAAAPGPDAAAEPGSGEAALASDKVLEREVAEDDPLSAKPGSAWTGWYQDNELREEIWKDVQRTHPGLHFFTLENYEKMERILFIYAKLNQGVRYVQARSVEPAVPVRDSGFLPSMRRITIGEGVRTASQKLRVPVFFPCRQGMNEVLAPIIFVFGQDKTPLFAESCEADAFFCFTQLMSEVRDLFIKGLDSSEGGLRGNMDVLMALLERHDPELRAHIEANQIHPQFFALRWFTTLLSRELLLPDTVRLWDSLLADPHRFRPDAGSFLVQFCCAMLVFQRDALLAGDFAAIVKLLQHYPPVDLHDLLDTAYRIRDAEEAAAARGVTATSAFAAELGLAHESWQESYLAARARVGAKMASARATAEQVKTQIRKSGALESARQWLLSTETAQTKGPSPRAKRKPGRRGVPVPPPAPAPATDESAQEPRVQEPASALVAAGEEELAACATHPTAALKVNVAEKPVVGLLVAEEIKKDGAEVLVSTASDTATSALLDEVDALLSGDP